MLSLAFRSFEFLFYHLLLSIVDRIARLPRTTMLPEAARLYRQNIALKAQLDALEDHLARVENKRRAKPLSVRAAQVFALLLTRGDDQFLRYFLSAPRATIDRWLTRFRSLGRRATGGRPRTDLDIESPGVRQQPLEEVLTAILGDHVRAPPREAFFLASLARPRDENLRGEQAIDIGEGDGFSLGLGGLGHGARRGLICVGYGFPERNVRPWLGWGVNGRTRAN